VPIPNGKGRHRAAPFGLGPWDGARVASHSRALSSAQVNCIVTKDDVLRNRSKTERRHKDQDSDRLFDLSCPVQLEIPPVWANSSRTVDAATSASDGRSQAARRFGWSGPYGEEFAPDKSASAMTRQSCSRIIVNGTSRRNVLGAIALGKERLQLPVATTTKTNAKQSRNGPRIIRTRSTETSSQSRRNRRLRRALPLRKNRRETVWA
jgi:hypothetical protein